MIYDIFDIMEDTWLENLWISEAYSFGDKGLQFSTIAQSIISLSPPL